MEKRTIEKINPQFEFECFTFAKGLLKNHQFVSKIESLKLCNWSSLIQTKFDNSNYGIPLMILQRFRITLLNSVHTLSDYSY
jgi:hypothetical protein